MYSPRNPIHQRFGPVVVMWYFRLACAGMFIMLICVPVVSFVLPGDLDPGILVTRWICGTLSCLGIVLLWRIFRSGVDDIRACCNEPDRGGSDGKW